MYFRIIIYSTILIVCSACQHATKKPSSLETNSAQDTKLAVISINDVYRINGIDNGDTGGLARVRELRKKIEEKYQHVLFLHAGDFLHPSFISKQDDGRAMIKSLNMMDGALGEFDDNMVVTWGNHEFDKGRMEHVSLMNELLSQAEFNWLDSNITWKEDTLEAENNLKQLLFQVGDKTVGIFSFTTDIVHPDYIKSFADYATTAKTYVPKLKAAGADFVIGLTHHWLQDDRALMNLPAAYRPDIIFGGHEHYAQIEQVNNNWILKADADAASAVVAEISFGPKGTDVAPRIISLDKAFPKDAATDRLTQQLGKKNDVTYCRKLNLSDDCLQKKLGHTKVKLMAEETEIRRFETNLGNALADLSLQAFAQCDADIALLNSGSIRLNQNLPAHSDITVKHLEEMFPYSSDLRLIEFDRQLLPEILNHSISSWTANGHWLQIAGMAYIHDPETTSASHIHLKGEPCGETMKSNVRAVVPYYLISNHTDHDGYNMINESMQVNCDANGAEVKRLFTEYLNQLAKGLAVKRDFRICNTSRDQCD